jgi:hypothetical protein
MQPDENLEDVLIHFSLKIKWKMKQTYIWSIVELLI